MRPYLIVALLAACVVVPRARVDGSSAGLRRQHLRNEAARLRSHFDVVDRELRARDASTLNAQQRAARLTLINWLRDYRDAGMFPQNNRFPDRATPFFRDDRGVLCAMAYLIARSGRNDIVDRVARTRNNAYIRELTDDTSLVQWLDDSGLTANEAARIQPAYSCGFPSCHVAQVEPPVSSDYKIASLATGAASLTTFGLVVASPSRPRAWAAVIAGSVEFVTGTTHLSKGQPTTRVAVANMILGGVTALAGARMFKAASRSGPAEPPRQGGKTIDLALMSPFNALTQGTQRGLQVRLTF